MADDKKPPTLPGLIGDKVYLRFATAEDVANTHHWYLLSDPHLLSPEAPTFLTPAEAAEAFRKQERSSAHERFTVIRLKDKTPVGWVRFFDLNPHNRSAALEVVIDPDERKKGHGIEAMRILCRYLFEYRGLNKVYARIADRNQAMVSLLKKAGFQRDGTLRRHYFYKGEYEDGSLYSLLRFEAQR
ncbi:MAG TPA: GNAT family protein [Acidobacteriota bacterium]|nr:GNAT family protein [Acidobacteriota bacterium]